MVRNWTRGQLEIDPQARRTGTPLRREQTDGPSGRCTPQSQRGLSRPQTPTSQRGLEAKLSTEEMQVRDAEAKREEVRRLRERNARHVERAAAARLAPLREAVASATSLAKRVNEDAKAPSGCFFYIGDESEAPAAAPTPTGQAIRAFARVGS